jgi:hypothetical protein
VLKVPVSYKGINDFVNELFSRLESHTLTAAHAKITSVKFIIFKAQYICSKFTIVERLVK